MWPMTRSFLNMDVVDFEDLLRSESASEHFIAQEVAAFKELKAKKEERQNNYSRA